MLLRKPWFLQGRGLPAPYLVRRLLPERFRFPCWFRSRRGAWHYVSRDPIDDWVLGEMLGSCADLYFPPLAAATVAALDRGAWCLDVGAFNGSWSAEMLARFPRARAIAVEPNPLKITNLRKTLQATDEYQRFRIIESAVADSCGEGWLVRSPTGSWRNWMAEQTAPRPVNSLTVPTLALAEILNGVIPVVVKCNAEGAEYTFVRQLLELDLRPHLLILMVHPEHGDVEELRARLVEQGYNLHTALDHPTRPCWHARYDRLDAT